MEPGDFFFVPGKTKNMLSTHASEVGKRMGAKFQTRLAWMSKVSGQWEPCAEGDDGAEKGIFVTRSE